MSVTRRQFVRQSATMAAAAIGLPMVASSRALGANEEIRMAIVGCGGRGGAHRDAFGGQPGVRSTAVCDPDRQRLASFAKGIEAKFGNRPAEVVDVRQLMDRKDFDTLRRLSKPDSPRRARTLLKLARVCVKRGEVALIVPFCDVAKGRHGHDGRTNGENHAPTLKIGAKGGQSLCNGER